jgi:HEAT repeat protein
MTLDTILAFGAAAAVLLWAGLSGYVLHVSSRRRKAREIVANLLSTLRTEDLRHATIPTRITRVKPLLERLSRSMLLHTAADAGTPRDAFDVLTAYILERWPAELLLQEASAHRRQRDIWRRTAALKILFQLNHARVTELLERAVGDSDEDVAGAALALLGSSEDPAAVDILISELRSGRQPAASVAVHLENSPQRPVEKLRPLLGDADPIARSWGAMLLGEYPGVEGLESELAALTEDPDARVRKAAIASLGRIGDRVAADSAVRLLADSVPFVRAHAARALGELERPDCAPKVAILLGDREWSVRAAAKQSLVAMGTEVWPVLMRCLDHSDGFVRNGAAEVFQNLGVLDSLIVMEAASDEPSPSKVDLLRRIAEAGGTRLTDSLVERAGPAMGGKVRQLLATMGLEHVGAA